MDETIAVQVARGAEWLDAVAPGWEHKVNTTALDMDHNCVIDQALPAGGWTKIYVESGPGWVVKHGFGSRGRDEWIATIEARRAEQRTPLEVHAEAEVVHHG